MTRVALLSDIHGNLPAFEAVLEDLKSFAVEKIIVAGDVVNWGPFSAQTMERLSAEQCVVIRGNNELYLTDWQTDRMPEAWHHFTVPPYTIAQLGADWLNVIATWPDTLSLRFPDAAAVRVVHGSARSAFEPIMPNTSDDLLEKMLDGVAESTVFAAHSHIIMDRHAGRRHLLNSGSVGNPLDGDLRASYMLLEGDRAGWKSTLRRVPYDSERLFQEFDSTGFVEQCGVVGYLIVQEYHTARLEVQPFLDWHRRTCPDEPLTMGLLERFSHVDKWIYRPLVYHINRNTP